MAENATPDATPEWAKLARSETAASGSAHVLEPVLPQRDDYDRITGAAGLLKMALDGPTALGESWVGAAQSWLDEVEANPPVYRPDRLNELPWYDTGWASHQQMNGREAGMYLLGRVSEGVVGTQEALVTVDDDQLPAVLAVFFRSGMAIQMYKGGIQGTNTTTLHVSPRDL